VNGALSHRCGNNYHLYVYTIPFTIIFYKRRKI